MDLLFDKLLRSIFVNFVVFVIGSTAIYSASVAAVVLFIILIKCIHFHIEDLGAGLCRFCVKHLKRTAFYFVTFWCLFHSDIFEIG